MTKTCYGCNFEVNDIHVGKCPSCGEEKGYKIVRNVMDAVNIDNFLKANLTKLNIDPKIISHSIDAVLIKQNEIAKSLEPLAKIITGPQIEKLNNQLKNAVTSTQDLHKKLLGITIPILSFETTQKEQISDGDVEQLVKKLEIIKEEIPEKEKETNSIQISLTDFNKTIEKYHNEQMAEHKKTQNNFIQQAVNGLFLIVLAFGLVVSAHIIIPISNIFNDPIKGYQIFMLVIPFATIVSSWMGFMGSIEKHPYSIGKWGNTRFIIDLIILLIYYLMLTVVSFNENITKDISDDNQLFAFFPILFLLYMIWDFVKEREYNSNKNIRSIIQKRNYITLRYFVFVAIASMIFLIVTLWSYSMSWDIVYYLIEITQWNVNGWTPQMTLNIIYGVVIFAIIVLFRYEKNKNWKL